MIGKVILKYEETRLENPTNLDVTPLFKLVAKSRGSSNHLITELYRYPQEEWEIHTFFGLPSYSKTPSPYKDEVYRDHLYYFEAY